MTTFAEIKEEMKKGEVKLVLPGTSNRIALAFLTINETEVLYTADTHNGFSAHWEERELKDFRILRPAPEKKRAYAYRHNAHRDISWFLEEKYDESFWTRLPEFDLVARATEGEGE